MTILQSFYRWSLQTGEMNAIVTCHVALKWPEFRKKINKVDLVIKKKVMLFFVDSFLDTLVIACI